MSRIEQTYNQFLKYLKGLLSNRERHDLERNMMQDVFDEEAFEGLNRLTGEELEADMEKLLTRLNNRVENKKTRTLTWFYRVAAAVVLLIGIGSILLLVVKKPADELITQKTEQTAKSKETTILPVEAPQTEASTAKEQADQQPVIKSQKPEGIPSVEIVIEDASTKEDFAVVEDYETMTVEDEAVIAQEEAIMSAPVAESQKSATAAPATAKSKKDGTVRIRGVSSISPSGTITGRVVDVQGQPLTGVNVMFKGSNQGTVTDMNGYFSLQPAGDNVVLALSYVGYNALEVDPQEASGKEITLTENVMALDEVVVVGYGTQKRSTVTGAITTVESKDISDVRETTPYNYTKPVPPGGSAKNFKEWVDGSVNKSLFISFPGKHRITIHLTVGLDGSLSRIRAEDKVPSVITDEYIRVIATSSIWQPAKENGTPVEAEIALRFVLEVE
ncbi:MAG: carboxypeptidase-like regulatory domain-containing protein [Bacteroidales bacterium]|nr:carboxypeptidase-like regulatory domain-containing protein [Bacteroidales bacterium]